jgi:hypothetical protein
VLRRGFFRLGRSGRQLPARSHRVLNDQRTRLVAGVARIFMCRTASGIAG